MTRPTLLVTGERSPATFLLITAELERCLEGESKVAVPEAGHGMHGDNPTFYNQAVIAFSSGASAGTERDLQRPVACPVPVVGNRQERFDKIPQRIWKQRGGQACIAISSRPTSLCVLTATVKTLDFGLTKGSQPGATPRVDGTAAKTLAPHRHSRARRRDRRCSVTLRPHA